jgi:hypothetical protein
MIQNEDNNMSDVFKKIYENFKSIFSGERDESLNK